MGSKICIKCGHATQYTREEPLACEECGAIYSKVEAAVRAGTPVARPASDLASSESLSQVVVRPGRSNRREGPFIDRLREGTNYPAFRGLVRVVHILGACISALLFIGGVVTWQRQGSITAALASTLGAGLLYVCFLVGKEVSLMLADLSDAAVYTAKLQEAANDS